MISFPVGFVLGLVCGLLVEWLRYMTRRAKWNKQLKKHFDWTYEEDEEDEHG